jgi:hypothetical protein
MDHKQIVKLIQKVGKGKVKSKERQIDVDPQWSRQFLLQGNPPTDR